METKTSSLTLHNTELFKTLSIPAIMGVYNVHTDVYISSQYVDPTRFSSSDLLGDLDKYYANVSQSMVIHTGFLCSEKDYQTLINLFTTGTNLGKATLDYYDVKSETIRVFNIEELFISSLNYEQLSGSEVLVDLNLLSQAFSLSKGEQS